MAAFGWPLKWTDTKMRAGVTAAIRASCSSRVRVVRSGWVMAVSGWLSSRLRATRSPCASSSGRMRSASASVRSTSRSPPPAAPTSASLWPGSSPTSTGPSCAAPRASTSPCGAATAPTARARTSPATSARPTRSTLRRTRLLLSRRPAPPAATLALLTRRLVFRGHRLQARAAQDDLLAARQRDRDLLAQHLHGDDPPRPARRLDALPERGQAQLALDVVAVARAEPRRQPRHQPCPGVQVGRQRRRVRRPDERRRQPERAGGRLGRPVASRLGGWLHAP